MNFQTFGFTKFYGACYNESIAGIFVIMTLVLAFSRTKGHGFLKGSGGDSIFFHVSDVNGEVGLLCSQGALRSLIVQLRLFLGNMIW